MNDSQQGLSAELLNFTEQNIASKLMDLVHSERVFTDLLIEEDQPVMAKGPCGWESIESMKPVEREQMKEILLTSSPA